MSDRCQPILVCRAVLGCHTSVPRRSSRRTPCEAVNKPCEAVNMPCEAVNMPCEAVNMPCEAVNMPCEAVNMHPQAAFQLVAAAALDALLLAGGMADTTEWLTAAPPSTLQHETHVDTLPSYHPYAAPPSTLQHETHVDTLPSYHPYAAPPSAL
jgi:hypothetical protein